MKKFFCAVFAMLLALLGLVSCDNGNSNFKIGIICLHDSSSTYDKNFIDAINSVKDELKLSKNQVIIKTNIPESNKCTEAAEDLVDQGCNVIFADSFGHEEYIIDVAKKNPEVEFCHATGVKAHTENLANYHNAFASIYEGRYLAGIAAGLKLNDLIADGKFTADEAKMGYVGAWPYAEVISGFTSFYLGAKSVCPTVTMNVKYTKSWYDETKEKETANSLIAGGCKLISQHADSMGAPTACETAKVPNVSYNGSTLASCPNTFIVSSKINWAPYFKYIIESSMNDTAIVTDWTGTIANGAVQLTDVNTNVAADGTQAAIDDAKAKLEAGTLHVFDCSKFTVEGATLSTYLADVDDDGTFVGETEAIENGVFMESKFRSAPYFNIIINGITVIE